MSAHTKRTENYAFDRFVRLDATKQKKTTTVSAYVTINRVELTRPALPHPIYFVIP